MSTNQDHTTGQEHANDQDQSTNQDHVDNITIGTGIIFGDFINAYMVAHPPNEHHHKSFERLISPLGIPDIIAHGFSISDTVENPRSETEEDRLISTVQFQVGFTRVRFENPTTAGNTSTPVILLPNEAINSGVTYSAPIITDVQIEATAHKRDGSMPTVIKHNIKNCELARMPIMVGSPRCNTYGNSRSELIANYQSPNDNGGYFIVKGREFMISCLEGVQYNYNRITKHEIPHEGELARSLIISKPGDAFENSYQIIVRLMVNGAITVQIIHPTFPIPIPFYVLYRILGITSDEDIINTVVSDANHPSDYVQKMVNILAYAITHADVPPMFNDIRNERDPQKVTQFLANRTTPFKKGAATASSTSSKAKRIKRAEKQQAFKVKGVTEETPAASKAMPAPMTQVPVSPASSKPIDVDILDENLLRANTTNLLIRLDKLLLPHMGQTPNDRILKLRFLGYMISQVLGVHLGAIVSTDQFSYHANRIETPGIIYSKVFKTAFNQVATSIRSRMKSAFTSTPFSSIQVGTVFNAAVNGGGGFSRAMVDAIINGKDTISPKDNSISKRIRAVERENKNDIFNQWCGRIIDKNVGGSSPSNNQKAMDRRSVHPSYLGYVCPLQSPDSGEKVGRIKQMTILTRITVGTSSNTLINELLADPDIRPLDQVADQEIIWNNLLRVFVNGRWIGLTALNTHDLALRYRQKRRDHKIDFETSIYVDALTLDLRFFTDPGRPLRPLLIVGGHDTPHGQDVGLTDKDMIDLRTGKLTMKDLEKRGVFEYIAPDEQDNTLIAENYTELRRNTPAHGKPADECILYTHCEIEQSILAHVTLSIPFGHHTQTQRGTIMTSQVKQACGWPLLNWQHRADKKLYVQLVCSKPLAKTITNDTSLPYGDNMIVAYMEFKARNQEDGSVLNADPADRGRLGVMNYTNRMLRLEKDQQIISPKDVNAIIKQDVNYEKLRGGIVPIGTVAMPNDALIGCVEAVPHKFGEVRHIDRSLIYKGTESMLVIDVMHGTSEEDGKRFVKLKLVSYRKLGLGSKISSRHGNKSVISSVLPAVDLPFTRSGIVPDLIITTHGFPKRMIFSQLIEASITRLCAAKGVCVDTTQFSALDLNALKEDLDKYGIHFMGYEPLIDGYTGEEINSLIFYGPTFYMRLQKFPNDSMHAAAQGPTDAVTRQPIKGRNVDGGLKLGEMEKDAICSQGIITGLDEKFRLHSDGHMIYICRRCGSKAIYNKTRVIYKCKQCKDNADIVRVPSTWMANVIQHNLAGSFIDLKCNPEKLIFYKNQ